MEKLVSEVSKLYNEYANETKVLDKMTYYITKQLPSLLEKYNNQEKKRVYVEKEKHKLKFASALLRDLVFKNNCIYFFKFWILHFFEF